MSSVLPTSVRHGDVLRLSDGDYLVVHRIERTDHMVGLSLYPCDVEPGRTYAQLCWFRKGDRVTRVKRGL